jgi:hypothetical protein
MVDLHPRLRLEAQQFLNFETRRRPRAVLNGFALANAKPRRRPR